MYLDVIVRFLKRKVCNIEEKRLLFSLSKKNGDFEVQPFKGSGKGGQKRNKTMSACRITHPASGAVSECQEERSFNQNKNTAFERLMEKPKFKAWFKIECARRQGRFKGIEDEIDRQMKLCNLVFETKVNDRWVKEDTDNNIEEERGT